MSAPIARVVDQYTGAKAPTKFFRALSEADEFIAQLERGKLAEADADEATAVAQAAIEERDGLLCRIQELEGELAARTIERDHFRDKWHELMAEASWEAGR